MDHSRIIRRAFEIVRGYRVLWVFGLLLALSGGGGPNLNYSIGQRDFDNGRFNFPFEFPNWRRLPDFNISPEVTTTVASLIIALICLAVALAVVFTVLRYVALAASIRMVDRYETTGERLSLREAWRLGWSNPAWRLFLIDLLIGVIVLGIMLPLLALVAAPLLLLTGGERLAALGMVFSGGLFLFFVLVMFVVAIVVGLLSQFFHRAAVLEGLGVMDAIRRGWQVLRRRLGDSVVMGLILWGLGLLAAVVLIPVALVLVSIGAVAGGLPAFGVGMLVQQATQNNIPAIVAGLLVGLPVFLLVVALPLAFLNGLVEIFASSAWTLAYRELAAE